LKRIGLTGGIGSGKSTLAGMLAGLGVPVLDLDAVGRRLHDDSEVIGELFQAFGSQMLNAQGGIDRGKLAAHCFADAERTLQLNAIMHPRIWRIEENWLAQQQAPYALIEASVLIESGGYVRMDTVIAVMADADIRWRRVEGRQGMSRKRFDAVLARQCNDKRRREVADYLIENNHSLETLQQEAGRLHQSLLRMA